MKILRGSRPTFSIIIPTYNRAHLLPLAVKSVLHQTFDDFEIVISNGGSTDNTRDVVAEFDDPRIRYFESDVRLPVGDNYQNGLNNARGDYITFLSDDDAYVPSLLQSTFATIEQTKAEIVGYKYCRYYHTEVHDAGQHIPKNSLILTPSTGEITEFSADDALKHLLAHHGLRKGPSNPRFVCPYLSNATYKRTIFDALRLRRSNLFDMVPPDMYLAAAVFFESKNYHCLDLELLVWSNWEGNSTASVQRQMDKLREHYRTLVDGKELLNTPTRLAIAPNCSANALLEALKEYDADMSLVDWTTYFVTMRDYLAYLKTEGLNVEEELNELELCLKQQSEFIRLQVGKASYRPKSAVKALMFNWMPDIARQVRDSFDRIRSRKASIILGVENGFSNVLEASRFVQ